MDVIEYLNQKATLERFLGKDADYNIETYASAKTIAVRVEGSSKYVRNMESALTISETCYWVIDGVKVRDKINGQEVISVKPVYDIDGSLIYTEAYV